MNKLFTFFENSNVFYEINANNEERKEIFLLFEKLKELNIQTYWDLTKKLKDFFEIKNKPK